MDQNATILEVLKAASKKPIPTDPDENLFDAGYLDSFALPDVVSELESRFGIRIPDSDLTPRKFESINAIGRYVTRAVAQRKS